MKNKFDVAVIGEWHLAFCTAACLADAGRSVVFVNPFGKWPAEPQCPVHEPGMKEMLEKARANSKLTFANGINDEWSADIVWMAVDTPVSDKDEPIVTPLLE